MSNVSPKFFPKIPKQNKQQKKFCNLELEL